MDSADRYLLVHSTVLCILSVFIGTALIITNVPVFIAIVANNKLRVRYAITASLFLAAAIGGVSCILRAYSIIIELCDYLRGNDCKYKLSESNAYTETPWNCLGMVASYFEVFSFQLIPITLLLSSIDRILVLFNPIGYYLHPKLQVIVQLSSAGLLQFFILTYVIIAKRAVHFTHDECKCYVIMTNSTYNTLLIIRMCVSTLSIVIMLIVLIKFRMQTQKIASRTKNSNLENFNMRQRGYTKALLFSCCFTFVIFVVPNMATFCARLFDVRNADLYNTYVKLISVTSTLDVLIIVMYRQQDITEETIHRFPFLPYFRILKQRTAVKKLSINYSRNLI